MQPPPDPVAQSMATQDLHLIKANLESTRMQYNERSRSLKDRLSDFRVQIEGLKVSDSFISSSLPSVTYEAQRIIMLQNDV